MHRYEDHPFIAIWETTQACDLACKHCRACAQPRRDPAELDTVEGRRLLETLAGAHVPLVVLTGGDPAKRPDLVELVAYGHSLGLSMGLTPSATPLVTAGLVGELADAGLSRLAISIDGPDAPTHDAFRGVAGSFDESLRILADARDRGIATQVNTTVHAGSINQLERIAGIVESAASVLWSVFYIVPTGRAAASMLPSAAAVEASLEQLADLARARPFAVKTTAAPHYRRVLLQRKKQRGESIEIGVHQQRALTVNDGRGFVFISHHGDIFPSGFLPVRCGNVRTDALLDVYRQHPIFRQLRDPDALGGKCGACEYRHVCAGSRARAYAMHHDLLAEDPLCAYVPPGYEGSAHAAAARA